MGILAVGCGGGGSPENGRITLGDIGWYESVAVANVTRDLLEEELGYEEVEIRTTDLDSLFEDVFGGDLSAFQDVCIPNHQDLLSGVEDDVELLVPWFRGQTLQGIAAPSYMDVTSLKHLGGTGADLILGIEPSSAIMEKISDSVIPAYELVGSSTPGMLSEIENFYENQEDFASIAWSPHWVNQRYDSMYLEDPFGELNNPATLSTIVHEDLENAQPVAYAFMGALARDPLESARQWARENRDVWQPWLEAAENARE